MNKADIDGIINNLSIKSAEAERSGHKSITITLPSGKDLLLLISILSQARDFLFKKGKYKKLRRFQVFRLWDAGKIFIALYKVLTKIF